MSVPWWQPTSFLPSLLVALVSTACWGTWSNTAKASASRGICFAHFYTDFLIGCFLSAVAFLAGLGGLRLGLPSVEAFRIAYALGAGATFGVANLILTTAIALAGLAVAFPLCIGTALVLGTLLTYAVDQRGHPALIFPGVLLALLGVVANARAHAEMQKSCSAQNGNEAAAPLDDAEAPPALAPGRLLPLCVVGGVLMALWAPLSAKAMEGDGGLSPYASFSFFTEASGLVGACIIATQHCGVSIPGLPRVGSETSLREYLRLPLRQHGWGLAGGFLWALGTLSNLVSGGPLGFILSYALGQTAPMVATVWGLAYYREFDGAPRASMLWIAAMFALFVVAIALLVLGGS